MHRWLSESRRGYSAPTLPLADWLLIYEEERQPGVRLGCAFVCEVPKHVVCHNLLGVCNICKLSALHVPHGTCKVLAYGKAKNQLPTHGEGNAPLLEAQRNSSWV